MNKKRILAFILVLLIFSSVSNIDIYAASTRKVTTTANSYNDSKSSKKAPKIKKGKTIVTNKGNQSKTYVVKFTAPKTKTYKISLSNVRNLSALYNVRANLLGSTKFDKTAKELNDILPSYNQYIEVKRKYQLKETTMDPDKRTLLRVVLPSKNSTTEETQEEATYTADIVERLMGNKPEYRFQFIQEHAKFVENLDV